MRGEEREGREEQRRGQCGMKDGAKEKKKRGRKPRKCKNGEK